MTVTGIVYWLSRGKLKDAWMADPASADASILAGTRHGAKLSEGDTVGMTVEITMVHDHGGVTVRLHGFGVPITIRAEHLSLIAKKMAGKPLFDKPD